MKRIIAFLLSFFAPGLGQFYNGEGKKGLAFWFLSAIIPLIALFNITTKFIGLCVLITLLSCFRMYIAIDATRLKPANEGQKKWYATWYGLLAIMVLMTFFWNAYPVYSILGTQSFRASTTSMAPTLEVGDVVVSQMRDIDKSKLQYGDLVVFKRDSQLYISRIVALPNDTLKIEKNFLSINGQPLKRKEQGSYVERPSDGVPIQLNEYGEIFPNGHSVSIVMQSDTANQPYAAITNLVVPERHYYLVGDNRSNSYDSRYWGALDEAQIVGKLSYILYDPKFQKVGQNLRAR